MRSHNVPQSMQKRVQRWYDYSWSRGRMNGAGDIHSIGLLPDKLKTELALHVNLETLRKVIYCYNDGLTLYFATRIDKSKLPRNILKLEK